MRNADSWLYERRGTSDQSAYVLPLKLRFRARLYASPGKPFPCSGPEPSDTTAQNETQCGAPSRHIDRCRGFIRLIYFPDAPASLVLNGSYSVVGFHTLALRLERNATSW